MLINNSSEPVNNNKMDGQVFSTIANAKVITWADDPDIPFKVHLGGRVPEENNNPDILLS